MKNAVPKNAFVTRWITLLVALATLTTAPAGAMLVSAMPAEPEPHGLRAGYPTVPPAPTATAVAVRNTPVVRPSPTAVPPAARTSPAAMPQVTATKASAPFASLPPRQGSVTLDANTRYPVRAERIAGWGYEIVDASEQYDLLLERDVLGWVAHQLWENTLYRWHSRGLRLTIIDAVSEPGCPYPIAPAQLANASSKCGSQGLSWGFGDGESAWVALGCAVDNPDAVNYVKQDPEECFVAIKSNGPYLSDIVLSASILAYGGNTGWRMRAPDFTAGPFAPALGRPERDRETGQWRWDDPCLTVVPVGVPAYQPASVPTAAPRPPAAPPTGRIAFTQGRDGGSDLAVVDAGNGKSHVVSANGRQPDVRGDGRIVFRGHGGGRNNLWVVNPDGSDVHQISLHAEDSYPHWDPAGNSVVFHSGLAGTGPDRLFIQWNTDRAEEPEYLRVNNGNGLQPLTGRFPVWLGGRLAYSGCDSWRENRNCGIWVWPINLLSPSGAGAVQITKSLEDRSTDVLGGLLLYASATGGNWDVYAAPTAGGKTRNLTGDPGQDFGGTFSPDGNYIAFMSDRGGWGIWIANVDGTQPRLLTAVPGGFGTDWQSERLAWGP